ncbi:unnamed protein product [Ambrosiozyma monospora]|uniref:Unnamed protein product n=1 Tax=Ambrosiozyma monospora TaxID=43982 RepID=A0A9W6YSK8_AMBMO|nr:unnamed protein product [Ambrosiozyma monospora]
MVATEVKSTDVQPKDTPYLKLYSVATPNGVKISLFLELLGIDYYVQKIDFSKTEQKEPWFLEKNPNGRIPTLEIVDAENNHTYISESAAILIWLADHYDTKREYSYGTQSPLYYEELEWLFFQMAGLGPMKGQYHHFAYYAPQKIEYGIKRYYEETLRLFGVLDERLKRNGTGYLVGDHLSLADIASWPWIGGGRIVLNEELEKFPHLKSWVENIGKLDAAKRAKTIPA